MSLPLVSVNSTPPGSVWADLSFPPRSVPAAVENRAVQCPPGGEEQGGVEVVWQVLSCRHFVLRRSCDWGRTRLWYYCFLMCYDRIKMTLHHATTGMCAVRGKV